MIKIAHAGSEHSDMQIAGFSQSKISLFPRRAWFCDMTQLGSQNLTIAWHPDYFAHNLHLQEVYKYFLEGK